MASRCHVRVNWKSPGQQGRTGGTNTLGDLSGCLHKTRYLKPLHVAAERESTEYQQCSALQRRNELATLSSRPFFFRLVFFKGNYHLFLKISGWIQLRLNVCTVDKVGVAGALQTAVVEVGYISHITFSFSHVHTCPDFYL